MWLQGRGIECARPEGLPAYTFIEEYLGELYSAYRWWEIQVRAAFQLKTLTKNEALGPIDGGRSRCGCGFY